MIRARAFSGENKDLAHVISESMVVSLCDFVACVNMDMVTRRCSVD